MNRSARVMHWPRRAWPPAARPGVAVIAATLALLAAACSSSPSSTGSGGSPTAGGSASSSSLVAYSACMRSHGVPDYPDPSGGQVPKADPQQLGVSTSELQAGQRSCQHLYPSNGGALGASLRQCEETGNCPEAMVHRVMNSMLVFSRCMRAHGALDWPDPTVDSVGRPGFNLVPIHGTDWNSPQIQNMIYECEHVMPAGGGVPAIYPGGPG